MKKLIISFMAILLLTPLRAAADDYITLWKQVQAAGEKDLPKTQISILQQIVSKASAEQNYGNLLKARLMAVGLQVSIAPDSLPGEIQRLQEEEKEDVWFFPLW